jgi:hypothetical protein
MDTSEKAWESEQLLHTAHQVCQILDLWKAEKRELTNLQLQGKNRKY